MKSVIRWLSMVVAMLTTTCALAIDTRSFDAATFATLQAAGKPVLVYVYADWCPTCKEQAPILSELLGRPEFSGYTVLKVNFDTQKDVRRTLGVSQQSTLIVYHGKRELTRTTGDTSIDSIEATLRKGIT